MSLVAIVGAGELGGAIAHKLAQRGRVGEIRLIDPAAAVAAGKALDIQQAGAMEPFAVRLAGGDDWWLAAGAGVIVLADAASPPGEWRGEPGLATLARLADLAPRACFVCAGAGQRELVERGVGERHLPRRRLVGSAPTAFWAAVRALVALELGGSPAEVAITVTGAPPEQAVIGWHQATARGAALSDLVAPPALARLAARIGRAWPLGPYALASAAARVVEAIALGGSPRAFTCFVCVEDELPNARGRAVALPVVLDTGGVRAILAPGLSSQERVQLENAVAR